MRSLYLVTAAALSLAACSDSADTSTTTSSEVGNGTTMAGPVSMPLADYASGAAIGDMYEIESSRLALTKASSDEVRQFAQRMIDDHTRTSNALKSFVETNGRVTLPARLDPRRQGLIMQLREASGQSFDRLYMAQQQAAHEEALTLHRGYGQSGDNAEARTLATSAIGVIEQHHQLLRSAMPAGAVGSDGSNMGDNQTGSAGASGGGMTVTPSRGISPNSSQSSTNPTRTNANGTTSLPSE